jgi:hypothetical protein
LKRNLYNTFIVIIAHSLCVLPFVAAYMMADFYSGEGVPANIDIWLIPFFAILLFTVLSTYFFFRGKESAAVVTGLVPVLVVSFLMSFFTRDGSDMLGAGLAVLFFLVLLNVEVLNKRKYAFMRAVPMWAVATTIVVLILLLCFNVLTHVFVSRGGLP